MNKLVPYSPKICDGSRHVFLIGFVFFLLSNIALGGDLKLAWNPSQSTGVGGYKLYYGQTSKNYKANLDVGNVTSYKMTGLTNGGTYFFAVKAYNAVKSIESAFSNEVSATVPALPALTPDFTPSKTNGPAPLIVTFTPTQTETVVGFQWNFGSSAIPTSTSQIPTVTFSNPGLYSVDLTITGSSGGATKITKQITVTVPAESQAPVKANPPISSNTSISNKPTNQALAPIPEPAPAPVAAYGFEERTGRIVKDLSGRGNHGSIKQAVRVKTGRYGKALKFDGLNDWVTIKHSESLNLSKEYTIEAWIKPNSQHRSSVIVKQQPKGTAYDLFAYEDHDLPSSSLNNGLNYSTVTGQNQLPIRQWVHLASTFDGINQRLYVDGVEVGSVLTEKGMVKQSNGVLRIGGNSVWGDFFQGYIDEVRIYNRALSDQEILRDLSTAISSLPVKSK